MLEWRRDGVAVTVARGEDDALKTRVYGVLSVDEKTRVLSLPEAYDALTHGLLVSSTPLADVWRDFATASSAFIGHYVVYSHFRRLGWRVRSGLNYGAAFVLYRGDAETFHSEYIVYVTMNEKTPWHAVQARTRVAEDVKKTVVLCEVTAEEEAKMDGPDPVAVPVSSEDAVMATHGRYKIHRVVYALDAVLIRYWDTATVDDDRTSYAFTLQPVLLKKPKKKTKK